MLDEETTHWTQQLVRTCPGVREVWLLGSRANGTARSDSDWDFLAFAAPTVDPCIRSRTDLHLPNIDLLLVDDPSGEFARAWGSPKTGSLTRWEWTRLSEAVAAYKSVRWIPEEDDSGATGQMDYLASEGFPCVAEEEYLAPIDAG